MVVYPNAAPSTLSDSHRRMLYDESGVDPAVAEERGYSTVTRRSELLDFGKKQRRASADAPALRVPLYSPDGITRLSQLRPHKPRVPGLKYETPAGAELIIDVHPRMRDRVRHGDEPLLITEGAKTGDAATSRDIPTVVLAGVWGWCVPGEKPYRLRPCFDHVNLEGREVNIAFDSDCMTKEGVQRALEALARCLEERGAVVKVIYLPDAADGSKQGIDDYLVGGGTIKEMFMLARSFEPADIGEIRLSRDQKLRAGVGYLWSRWHESDWMRFKGTEDKGNWQRGHTARDTEEALIRLATKSGKQDGRGVVVRVGLRRLARLAAKSAPSVGDAVKHLEAAGRLEILPPEDRTKARRYRLLVPSAALYSMRGSAAEGTELGSVPPRCKGLRYPSASRLMWSSPARLGRLVRSVEGATGRTVAVAIGENIFAPPDYRPYGKRLGPHRGAVLDALEDAGGELHLKELCEVLHRKRPWDVRRRILKPLEEAGIIECEGDVIKLAADWLARLEEERGRTGEISQAEEQRKKHRREGESYREHLERQKHGTPEASLAAVRRTKDLRERRLRERREEEEKDRAPTPPAVEALLARILREHDRMRVGLLCEVAMEKGLRWRDVRPALERMGYRVERLPEYGNAEFVFTERGLAGNEATKKPKKSEPANEPANACEHGESCIRDGCVPMIGEPPAPLYIEREAT